MTVMRPKMRFTTCLALLLLVVVNGLSMAQATEPFVVKRADFTLDQSVLLLDLVVESKIPDYIELAIEQVLKSIFPPGLSTVHKACNILPCCCTSDIISLSRRNSLMSGCRRSTPLAEQGRSASTAS